jgi:hypothetical protein
MPHFRGHTVALQDEWRRMREAADKDFRGTPRTMAAQ